MQQNYLHQKEFNVGCKYSIINVSLLIWMHLNSLNIPKQIPKKLNILGECGYGTWYTLKGITGELIGASITCRGHWGSIINTHKNHFHEVKIGNF